jgi:hypothetical protein
LVEGCDRYTINANAIYTQTGAQSLKYNAGVVEQTIAAHIKNDNGSLRISEERQPIPGRKNACPPLRSVFCTCTQQSKRVA